MTMQRLVKPLNAADTEGARLPHDPGTGFFYGQEPDGRRTP